MDEGVEGRKEGGVSALKSKFSPQDLCNKIYVTQLYFISP